MAIPHTVPGVWPSSISPARLASLVRRDSPDGCSIGLIGLADDLGVRLNGGRSGARDGPRAFRDALSRYGVADPHGWDWPVVYDAGDIAPAEGDTEAALHETHRRVTQAAGALLDLGLFPVAVGGGHDLTFPVVRAVSDRCRGVDLAYCDAHLDVRDKAGSGMAVRAIVEKCGTGRLKVFGLDRFANSREHVEWFVAHGGSIAGDHSDGKIAIAPAAHREFAFSFDLDVLDGAHAPGVSATNPRGWDPPRACRLARIAGEHARCRCFDVMELSPPHDEGGRTARLAARLVVEFLRGFAARKRGRE